MKCPKCSKEMEAGFIFIQQGPFDYSVASLWWRSPDGGGKKCLIGLKGLISMEKPETLSYRCGDCRVITFQYAKPEEAEKKKK